MDIAHWFEPGHVAIVTGGSRGLGRALVQQLLQKGLRVVTDGRDPVALAAAREEFGSGEVVCIPGDVADRDHVHDLVREARRRFGRIDLLVNNASTLGKTPLKPLTEMSWPNFERIFTTNVFAPLHLIQHALPSLQEQQVATIVNIVSDAGVEGYPTWGGYGSSKAALEQLSRVLAAELEGTHVRVVVFDPGDMNTQMHRDAIPDADPATLSEADEVASRLLALIAMTNQPFVRATASSIVEAFA
ncbi:MAG: SDR family oxidoreductase [Candidatus Eremiobacteraeota bacterium]|nr:SDR family oxidoreductase [Candidatus Eremiobacteraeota bacterium]